MNKYSLVGRVSFFRIEEFSRKNGQGTIKKFSWALSHKVGNQFNSCNCESWNASFEALQDGMIIELTEYIPRSSTFQDKTTAQQKTRYYMDVREARVVEDNEIGGGGLVCNTTQPKKVEFKQIPQEAINEFNKMVSSFDVEKEIEKLKADAPLEEEAELEEVVNLDDWDNITHETNAPTPKIDEEAIDYVPSPVQKFPTQEFLDSLNNIPKPNNNTKIDLKGAGGTVKDLEDNDIEW